MRGRHRPTYDEGTTEERGKKKHIDDPRPAAREEETVRKDGPAPRRKEQHHEEQHLRPDHQRQPRVRRPGLRPVRPRQGLLRPVQEGPQQVRRRRLSAKRGPPVHTGHGTPFRMPAHASRPIPEPTETTSKASIRGYRTGLTIPVPTQTEPNTSVREYQTDRSIPEPTQTKPVAYVREQRAGDTIPKPTETEPNVSAGEHRTDRTILIPTQTNTKAYVREYRRPHTIPAPTETEPNTSVREYQTGLTIPAPTQTADILLVTCTSGFEIVFRLGVRPPLHFLRRTLGDDGLISG